MLCAMFVLSAAAYANAAVALFPVQEKPLEFADQEGCYLEHLHKVIPYGDHYEKKSCYKYICHSDNTTQVLTCGVAITDSKSPCIFISDEDQDYPDCCPKLICHTIPPEDAKIATEAAFEHQTTSKTVESKAPATGEPATDVPRTSESLTTEEPATSKAVPEESATSEAKKPEAPATSDANMPEAPATSEDKKVEAPATSEANKTEALATSEAASSVVDDGTLNELLIAQATLNNE